MALSVISRRPSRRITIDGRLVPDEYILDLHFSFGWDLRVSQATVTLRAKPEWLDYYGPILIEAGPSLAQRWLWFGGFAVDRDRSLWPKEIILICRGPLYLAQIRSNNVEGGTDLCDSGNGKVSSWMVGTILDGCGLSDANLVTYGFSPRYIHTTTAVLGTVADDKFIWQQGQKGLDFIDLLDKVDLGERTYEIPGAAIQRRPLSTIPLDVPIYTFAEYVDIERGTAQEMPSAIRNRIPVTGYDPGGGVGPAFFQAQALNPYLQRLGIDYLEDPLASDLIERETADEYGDGLSCEDVANWKLGELNRIPVKITFSTPRGDRVWPSAVIQINASNQLGFLGRARVQRVDVDLDRENRWDMTITAIGGATMQPPSGGEPVASFTMWLHQELIISGGAEVTLYTVYCRDNSLGVSGAISTRTWTATGGTPSSGSGTYFVTTYTSLTAKEITLAIEDENGETDSITLAVPAAAAATWHQRPLVAAGGANAESFDGSTWRIDPENAAATVNVVSNGPIWGAGATAMVSDDYLATSADESTPFDGVGETISAAWVETDLDTSRLALGSSAGRIAISEDTAATWTVKDGPDANPVLRIVLSRFNLTAIWLLTSAGFYLSLDLGNSWTTLVAAAEGETFRDVNVSHTRQMIVMDGGRLAVDGGGNTQTFEGTDPTDVVAVTADIEADRFYAYDSDGNTWYTSADGGTEFGAMAALPVAAVVQSRGLWRDGMVRGLLYIAGGTGGAWKSVDGFASAGGYFQIRSPGVGNSPAGADYAQIGADGLLASPFTAVTEYSDADWDVLSLWDGAANVNPHTAYPGWERIGYDRSAWTAATEQGDSAEITGAKEIWAVSVADATEECIMALEFTVGAGHRSSVSWQLTADNAIVEIYFNNLYQGSKSTAKGTVLTITIDPAQVLTGTNCLAVWVRNTS